MTKEMTKVGRLAKLIGDLEILRVITAEQVRTLPGLEEGTIMVVLEIPEENRNARIFVEDAFKEEFPESVRVFGDTKVLQAVVW